MKRLGPEPPPIYMTEEEVARFPALAHRGYRLVRRSRTYRCPACGDTRSWTPERAEEQIRCTMVRAGARCEATMEAL